MWKEVLDFDLRIRDAASPVKSVVNAVVGVSNVGLDDNWLGNHLVQANLYGFGKLAWNANLTSKKIIDDWTKLTFGPDPKVLDVVTRIQLDSWRTFENYTGPLGLQTLTDITGNHYGVAVEASEGNGWGQWHRADDKGVGMDRTVATGTGYAGQYRPAIAKMYESLSSTPDEVLTWFHHVPYTYKLRSGKTVIQHLYDAHYEGAAAVEGYARDFQSLKVQHRRTPLHRDPSTTRLPSRPSHSLARRRQSMVREGVQHSGRKDRAPRTGTEAEAMKLDGYTPMEPIRWESASAGKAVECKIARCEASLTSNAPAGWYRLRVQYFDQNNGQAPLPRPRQRPDSR